MYLPILLFLFFLHSKAENLADGGYCDIESKSCKDQHTNFDAQKLLFYDVNPSEGFNLRRDVYMRLAIMFSEARKRNKKREWSLILPPWYRLYHWRSERNERKPHSWSNFFDVKSMKSYAPALELQEVFMKTNERSKYYELDRIYVLKNFPDMFDGNFEERWKITSEDCDYEGMFWGYGNITAKEIICVNFLGKASKLWELIAQHPTDKKVMISHAEVALHDSYGTKEYWDCRKSMKFNENLINSAKKYIEKYFNCSISKCDSYIAVHWRRQDFASSRSKDVPSVLGTVKQIKTFIKEKTNNITHVFIATDAPQTEIKQLIIKLKEVRLQPYLFTPGQFEIEKFKDGGLAIIEQIICSHAAFFIGTHESTFSYRIQEEREILGFKSDTSFNRLCPDAGKCEKPSKWTIVN